MPEPFGIVRPRDWGTQNVFILGGGSSLAPFRAALRHLHHRGHILAINDAWKDCRAEAVFTVDHVWLARNSRVIPTIPAPVTAAVAPDHERPPITNLTYVLRRHRSDPIGLSRDPGEVMNLLNSGASGVDYAVKRGARQIFLLGFDFMPGPDQATHYHEGYEWHSRPNTGRMYPRWAKILDDLRPALDAEGVAVFNCSPRSLLTAYRHRSYEEFLT